jgi:hypothetical protein
VAGITVLIFFREPSELKLAVPGKGKNEFLIFLIDKKNI